VFRTLDPGQDAKNWYHTVHPETRAMVTTGQPVGRQDGRDVDLIKLR
jgi:hypothetical protein